MRWTTFLLTAFLLCHSALAAHFGDNSCDPPKQGDLTPVSCCNIRVFPSKFKEYAKACLEKNPDLKKDRECLDECLLESSGLLTAEKRLDKVKAWTQLQYEDSADTNGNVKKALKTCIDQHPDEIETESKCKSGASQFLQCYMREVFVNCPKKLMSVSEQVGCSNLKTKVEKCEKLNVYLVYLDEIK